MYFLYEIKFPDGYFYIGITKNLKMRFSQHKRSKYPVGIKIRESGLLENAKAILCFDVDHNFIGEFGSVKIASDYLGIPDYSISKVLRGVSKKSSGFIFKYKKLADTEITNRIE